jgi:[protein-PII] uridylyltransferase
MNRSSPGTPAVLAGLRQQLAAAQRDLATAYLAHPEPRTYLRARCDLVDQTLAAMWAHTPMPSGCALIAVGGYGRGELYPFSDIDVLIALEIAPSELLEETLQTLISQFWDLGLAISHSVRTIDECLAAAEADVTIQTALYESRWVCGEKKLARRLSETVAEAMSGEQFIAAKMAEQEERHLRHAFTAFSLEPNVKESPGGLRDLQMIRWIAHAGGFVKGADTWSALQKEGLMQGDERVAIERAANFLADVRIHLHLLTGRSEDRLLFDLQGQMAQQFGFSDDSNKRASEQFMQRYYRIAKRVSQINTLVLKSISEKLAPASKQRIRPLNERFQKVGHKLDIVDPQIYQKQPSAILETFLLMEKQGGVQEMTSRTLRALYAARRLVNREFRQQKENKQLFIQILRQKNGVLHALRLMNQFSILGRYIPAFGKIVGQMQHDLFHVFTVDQHILQVVRNIRRFQREDFAHENPFCHRLIAEFERPWLLVVAALFHDIAKGRGGDHSELGTVDAETFCTSHAMTKKDTALVVWLVREHLTMSSVAQKEDISDPTTIAVFCKKVRDARHLTALYLLTVADIRGTSPKVWNSWKARLLETLYQTSLARLEQASGDAADDIGDMVVQRKREALAHLRYFALGNSVQTQFWKQLDDVYFLRHTDEEIAWHTRCLYYRTHENKPVVRARPNPESEGIQVLVYAPDQADLFVRLCAYFSAIGYSIMDAKIHTTRHAYALDSFNLLDASDRGMDRETCAIIEHDLLEILNGTIRPLPPRVGRVSRQVRSFPITPDVLIEPDESGQQYVVSIRAADRTGLLYAIAETLTRHGASLHTARISTLGERVEDTFLISGRSLNQSRDRLLLENDLLEQLKIDTPARQQ